MQYPGWIVAVVATSLFLMTAPAIAGPQHGVNMSSDGMMAFVSKDVGDERWAIMLRMDTMLAIGNVYRPDGGDPAFVWCPMKSMHGDMGHMPDADITFSCYGTSACGDACPGWDFIDDVTLPGSFFFSPQQR